MRVRRGVMGVEGCECVEVPACAGTTEVRAGTTDVGGFGGREDGFRLSADGMTAWVSVVLIVLGFQAWV